MTFCKETYEKALGKKEFGWEIKKHPYIKQGRDSISRFWLGVAVKGRPLGSHNWWTRTKMRKFNIIKLIQIGL